MCDFFVNVFVHVQTNALNATNYSALNLVVVSICKATREVENGNVGLRVAIHGSPATKPWKDMCVYRISISNSGNALFVRNDTFTNVIL